MIKFKDHPLYDEVIAFLPEGSYGDIEVPALIDFEETANDSGVIRLLMSTLDTSFVDTLRTEFVKDQQFMLLSAIGYDVYMNLFLDDKHRDAMLVAMITDMDKHFVEKHSFNRSYTEIMIWSNAFASYYGQKLGWYSESFGSVHLTKNPEALERYMHVIRLITPDIEANSREKVSKMHIKYVTRLSSECGVAKLVASNGLAALFERYKGAGGDGDDDHIDDEDDDALEEIISNLSSVFGKLFGSESNSPRVVVKVTRRDRHKA